jgi:ABC-type lipoprotein export system ATPase subunit
VTRADLRPEAVPSARVRAVVKSYLSATGPVRALDGVDADFPSGLVTVVAGPSGSGKSTLLRLLACGDRPDSGVVEIGGQEVSALGARGRREVRRRQVGYVFQEPAANLVDYLTAAEHVALGARLRRAGGGARVGVGVDTGGEPERLLGLVGLGSRAGHRPAQLSGGEQQRLALAFAVAGSPALLVADEPTAQLDHASGALVLDALRLLAGGGVGVVVSSHDPDVLAAADRAVHVVHGRVEEAP